MFSPKQNRAMLIRVSFSDYIRIGIKSPTQKAQERTHWREVVEDVALRPVSEYDVSRYRHYGTRDQRRYSRYVCDGREPVECRRPQAPINQQRIVVADERKANDTDSLENPRLYE